MFLDKVFTKRIVKPSVSIKEIDKSLENKIVQAHKVILGKVKRGVPKVVYLGTTIKSIKWYQFWRWHLKKEYIKQCKECNEIITELFGST